MLKFAVLCFLVIMASTSAEQCGDQVCGAGTCCAEYPEMHCKRVGQLYDICVDAQATKDSGNHLFFCPSSMKDDVLRYELLGSMSKEKLAG
uniref:U25-Hexatoxin-Hc1o_1 n=1 Tax=Hadronyche cerberea TaxID=1107879 RepID=A0A4Q8K1E5_HADCE